MFFRKYHQIQRLEQELRYTQAMNQDLNARTHAVRGANDMLRTKFNCAALGQSAADKRATELEKELAKARNTISTLQYSLREHDDALDERLRIIDAQARKIRRLAYIIDNPGFVAPISTVTVEPTLTL